MRVCEPATQGRRAQKARSTHEVFDTLKPAETARSWLLDFALIFLLTAALIWPLFRLKYMDNWGSIESTFISDARMIRQNWNQGGWQPLWYCGTRLDYIYPPALRFGTALISLYPRMTSARAYHIYTAFFYCLGIAGVYLLARIGFRSRRTAWLCAAAAALLSPAYVLFLNHRVDAAPWHLPPMRLHVLLRYGEGPHISAFALLPFALAAAWLALPARRPAMLALAGIASAAVVSTNFYGATALAIFFPILCWSLWTTHHDKLIWVRSAAVAALAYGLTAFWLTPSYLRITLDNMRLVSRPGNAWSVAAAGVCVLLFAVLSRRVARGKPARAWSVFVLGSLVIFSLDVIGNRYLDFRIIGEPGRLVPELDLVIILSIALGLGWLWNREWEGNPLRRRPWMARAFVLVVLLLAFREGRRYAWHAWDIYPRDPAPKSRVEHQITEWIAKNIPGSRVFVSGSVRFWYNAWHDLPQVGGGSEQGVLNGAIIPAMWEWILGTQAEPGVLWMQALGADAIVVNDKSSAELYHDYGHPKKFDGVLPVIHDNRAGDRIYQAPRRFTDRARVVEKAAVEGLAPFKTNDDLPRLRAYVNAVEHGPGVRAALTRLSPERINVRARVEPGQALLVQESFDPYWKAYLNGRALAVQKDMMGFMLIDAPPGDDEIQLVFELPMENLAGRLATGISLVLTLLLLAGLPRRLWWRGVQARLL